MITLRPSGERGHANYGWLDTRYTFSFANYYHPDHMGFRQLRVMNEDWIDPGEGFGTHPHNNMEIITYLISGELAHRDSMNHLETLKPHEVQVMSAGRGITHSEYNPSHTEKTHLLQIWILPETRGLTPRYDQQRFDPEMKTDRLCLIASRGGRDGSLHIHQDVNVYASCLAPQQTLSHTFAEGRYGWLQLIHGAIELNGDSLNAGDGAAICQESTLTVTATAPAEFLLFDLN
ncbi:MAG: pirin family protein [Gemmatimonadetes bacterium]|nr:MAG: pirin family protein [Gemmatimonadota bacterium]